MVDRLNNGNHQLLHTKYISCGPRGFRKIFFQVYPNFKSMTVNDPLSVATLDPRSMVDRI